MTNTHVLQASGLTVEYGGGGLFTRKRPVVQAVSNVDISIEKGETLAIVGESGSGKSTLGRALLRITPITQGTISFKGEDITTLDGEDLRKMRRHFQMIFQDPYSSLNPKNTIFETIAEPLWTHTDESKASVRARVLDILETVGLDRSFADRYPHQFSGGQRQRVAIARTVVLRPDFIVADEPLSALDVSLQLQMLKLFERLKSQFALTYLLISHDLARVFSFADRIAVMYLGKIVEIGSARDLFHRPAHPYTRALIAAAPSTNPQRGIETLGGEIPSPLNPPSGCRFHKRCPMAMDLCRQKEPPMTTAGTKHNVACHLFGSSPAPQP